MQPTDSIIKAGVLLIMYEFLFGVTYFFLSNPIVTILNSVINTNIVPELAIHGPLSLTVFDMIFAVAVLIPIVWFIAWVMREEPVVSYKRYY